MSNTIIIKHGENIPSVDNLENYELGYSESNDGLYIKNKTGIRYLNDLKSAIDKAEADLVPINEKIEDLEIAMGKISGVVVGTTAPADIGALWIDIAKGPGVAKYYNPTTSTWTLVAATWG